MYPTTKERAQKILEQAPLAVSIGATGAGAGLQKLLWDIPGISKVLVDAQLPYRRDATQRFLRYVPMSYCSASTAIEMAMESYYRSFTPNGPKAIGIGIAASVTSDYEHKGELRIYAAWFADHGCEVFKAPVMARKPFDVARIEDGNIADVLGLQALEDALGLSGHLLGMRLDAPQAIAHGAFFRNPVFLANGARTSPVEKVDALFPGSFNPPHEGHFGLADAFQKETRLRPMFSITVNPPHKEPLSVAEMLQRAKSLEGFDRMFEQGSALYLDKAQRYPNTPILLGTDSVHRMLDPKWGIDVCQLGSKFGQLGTVFYTVESRQTPDDLIELGSLSLPPGMNVKTLPGKWEVSSTALRTA